MPRKWPVFQTAVETGGSRHLVCPDTKRVSDSLFTTELQLDAAAAVRASNAGTPARSVPGNRSTVAIATPVRIGLDRNPLGDAAVEADEAYVNAGKKGIPHDDPADPPRRRANGRRGHGTFANDRPPVAGWSAGTRARPDLRSSIAPMARRWRRSSSAPRWRARPSTRTNGGGTPAWRASGGATSRSARPGRDALRRAAHP